MKKSQIKGSSLHIKERLFKGSPENYLRLRAKKHRTQYNDHDQADIIEGLADKVIAMRSRIKHLESTNKQLIDALREAQKAIETLPEDALGIATTSDGSTNYYVVDELLHHIKQALRNAGEMEE